MIGDGVCWGRWRRGVEGWEEEEGRALIPLYINRMIDAGLYKCDIVMLNMPGIVLCGIPFHTPLSMLSYGVVNGRHIISCMRLRFAATVPRRML